nr:glycoside hydrolase family 16 protein [Colletotrichum truncatum]KAF6796702.1 glycoside hydrolase family 16 protein [Colletotrichum truncatum]
MRDLNGKETQAKFYMYDKLVTTQVGTGYFEKPMNLAGAGFILRLSISRNPELKSIPKTGILSTLLHILANTWSDLRLFSDSA